MPITVGVLGAIAKDLEKHLDKVDKLSTHELQILYHVEKHKYYDNVFGCPSSLGRTR